MEKIVVRTSEKKEVVDITELVHELLKNIEIKEGVCTLHLMHTTAALTTADLDPGTDEDILKALEGMVPKLAYRHPHDPKHVSDHILSAIVGTSLSIPFKNRELLLGTWQQVVLLEFSGPRPREIVVSILG